MKGKVTISNQEFVLKQLGSQYNTTGGALKEYITNGIEAIYDANLRNGSLNIIINKNGRWMALQDNGLGMSYGRLSEIMQKIGDSIKRYKSGRPGEKGIGNLAFLKFADNLTFLSRTRDGDPNLVNVLKLDSSFEWDTYTARPDHLSVPDIIKNIIASQTQQGTIVYIEDIDERIMEKSFSPSKLESLISEIYTPLLNKDEVSIIIGYQDKNNKIKKISVGPLEFQDELLLEQSIQVKDVKLKDGSIGTGTIDFLIFLNQKGSNDKIGVYHEGIKVNGDLSAIEYLNDPSPWNCGKLQGYVNDNFLELNAPRNSFEYNANLKLWLPKIEEIGNLLRIDLKRYRSERDKEAYEIADKVLKAIDLVYKQHADEWRKFFIQKKVVKRRKEKQVVTGVEDIVTEEEPIIRTERMTRRTLPFLIPDFVAFGLDEEERYRSKLVGRSIKINTKHPDYKKYYEGKSELEKANYILDLLSKEIGYAATKNLLMKEREERLSPDEIILLTKEMASNIYYESQRQLRLEIKGKL